jgi:hypothetical protein
MMQRRFTSFSIVAAAVATCIAAEAQTPPAVYSVTEINSMFGPSVTMKVYRDGAMAIIDHITAAGANGKTTHSRSLYNLQTKKQISWDADDPAPMCGNGTFGGSWGDPFEDSVSMNADLAKEGAKNVGNETIVGILAKVMTVASAQGGFKAWVDPKTGLLLKLEMTPPNGATTTMVEVKEVSFSKPPATVFIVPKSCRDASAPPPPSDLQRFAAETGGQPEDFANAAMAPAEPSRNSCTVLLRAVAAGSMQPVSRYKVSIDNVDKTAQLRNGILRIENAPRDFDVSMTFGDNGGSFALIHRQCPLPETVLLMVLKNPNNVGEGADWMWAKSGKYAK